MTLSAEGIEDVVSESYNSGSKTLTVDLSEAEINDEGRAELTVMGTTDGATLQMTYIKIADHAAWDGEEYFVLPPGEVKIPLDSLPEEGFYISELTEDFDWFVDYRNLENSTDRYFFINTFSDDTFDEKTVSLDLEKGENTIRIYNDNSWNVTYGGSTSSPATTYLPNYTPNFDKFIITPAALETPVEIEDEYIIDVVSTDFGTASADRNSVGQNGEYTLSVVPDNGKEIVSILVNGEDMKELADYNETDNVYTLTVTGVNADQKVQIYFDDPSVSREALQNLYNEYKDMDQNSYSDYTWKQLQSALEEAGAILEAESAEQWEIGRAYDRLLEAVNNLEDISRLIYFVDCGDHDPSTLTDGDSFGLNNSVTDQMYGEDPKTGYCWGVWMMYQDETETPGQGSANLDYSTDKAVYTNYQKALSNTQSDLADGQKKEATFRYAHGQDTAGISPRYVAYMFEVEPGKYDITVGMSNTWANAGSPSVLVRSGNIEEKSEYFDSGSRTISADLSEAEINDRGMAELLVLGTTDGATLQMTYIEIEKTAEPAGLEKIEIIPPEKLQYEINEQLNTEGMVVQAVYSDGSVKILLPEQYVIEGFSSDSAGKKTVTVSYSEGDVTVSADFDVMIKEASAPPVTDKTGLKEMLEKAKSITSDGYTAQSFAYLQDAVKAAEAVYNDAEAGQDAVDEQIQKLISAIAGLEKSEEDGKDPEEDDAGQSPEKDEGEASGEDEPGMQGAEGDNEQISENPSRNDKEDAAPETGDDIMNLYPEFIVFSACIAAAIVIVKKKYGNKRERI